MRQAFEAAAKAYETVKKSVHEKWEAFKNKFEGTKSEMAKQVIDAKSPEDLIAAGKKLQQQGEVLKAEEESVKREKGKEEELETEMLDQEDAADYEESVREQESADMDKIMETDRFEAEKEAAEQAAHEEYIKNSEAAEQAKLAELRDKLGLAQEHSVKNEQLEKISEAKKVFMHLFDRAPFRDFDQLIASSENILDNLSENEQEQLAKEFHEETIGSSMLNIPNANQVYREFRGTAFAKKYAEIEDARLKRAGFSVNTKFE